MLANFRTNVNFKGDKFITILIIEIRNLLPRKLGPATWKQKGHQYLFTYFDFKFRSDRMSYLFLILVAVLFLGCGDGIVDPVDEGIDIILKWSHDDSEVVMPNGDTISVRDFRADNQVVRNTLQDSREEQGLYLDIDDETIRKIRDNLRAPKMTIGDLTPSAIPVGIALGEFYFRIAIESHRLGGCIQQPAVPHMNISVAYLGQPGTIANAHLAVWKNQKGETCLGFLLTGSKFPDQPCRVVCFPTPPGPDDFKAAITEGLIIVGESLEASGDLLGTVLKDAAPTAAVVLGVMVFFMAGSLA